MIRLTRLNSQPLAVNSDLIKFVENAPDTVLTLINGEKVVVRETTDQVIERMIAFRRAVLGGTAGAGNDPNVVAANTHPSQRESSHSHPEGTHRG